MSNEQSRYCYQGTNVLINKLNIKDEKILNQAEADFSNIRLLELARKPLVGKFDLKHLQKIHKFIFQDLYDFAGELRNENIAKGNFMFASAQFIRPEAEKLFNNLKNDKFLKGLSLDEFSNKASFYMAEINILHPFREGNGRTQREFIRNLATKNGFKLDWSKVDKKSLYDASLKSIVDTKDLADIIKGSIDNKEPIKDLMKDFDVDFTR